MTRAMNRIARAMMCTLCALWAAALPAAGVDAPALLAKAAATARDASYRGTYVYSSAGITESARVVHVRTPGGDAERIESLDGQRREVIRRGDEIRYLFLDSKTVRVDRRVSGRSFPDFLPAAPSELTAFYAIEAGGTDRAAGRVVQVIRLRSKDASRYSQEVWIDRDTSLPLKRRLLDERGDIIEQFVFTEIAIGKGVDTKLALSGPKTDYAGWRVQTSAVDDPQTGPGSGSAPAAAITGAGASGAGTTGAPSSGASGGVPRSAAKSPVFFEPAVLPAGFRKTVQVSRRLPGREQAVAQTVYSDGLATFSVFADRDVSRMAGHEGYSQRGAIGVLSLMLGDHAVIVVGEVPGATLRKVGDSLAAAPRR